MQDVYFVTECTVENGLGHLSRSMSLADAFNEKGLKCHFLLNIDDPTEKIIPDINYSPVNWKQNIETIFLRVPADAIVVIDSYLANSDQLKAIADQYDYPVFISDQKMKFYPKGVVIFGNPYATQLILPDNPEVHYLKGKDYILFRKAFWDVPSKKINKGLSSILVTMGGFASYGFISSLLEEVFIQLPHIRFTLLGDYADDLQHVAENIRLVKHYAAGQMKEAMLKHDLIISNGGQTLNEALRTGIPAIVIAMAENQISNIQHWEMESVIHYLGRINGSSEKLDDIKLAIESMRDEEIRKRFSLKSRNMIDGQGARRAVKEILHVFRK